MSPEKAWPKKVEKTKNSNENLFQWQKLENYVFNEENFYRIVDERGYNDFLETGIVRSSPTGTDSNIHGRFDLGHRPTGFPSFSKGSPDFSYCKSGEDNYIFESAIPMFRRGDKHPIHGGSIKGRHWAYRPINPETGEVIKEITKDMIINIYKIDKESNLYLRT